MVIGTIVSLIKKVKNAIKIAKIKIGLDILFMLIPQAFNIVISDCKHILLTTITVENNTLIGIVITITAGRFKRIIINAILKGIPYVDICFINEIKVSEAKIIEVKTIIPRTNTSITCFNIYLSRILKLKNDFISKF